MPQWEDEIRTKTNLSYVVYYGQGRSPSPEELANVDVVITTYGTVQGEQRRQSPLLERCEWGRIILDEAHCIRNTQTVASKVCCRMKAKYRWCVTGTIIQNSLDDIFGLLKFLHHEPWCLPGFWKAAISRQMTMEDNLDPDAPPSGMAVALDRIRRMLRPIMIRRTKDSIMSDGKPILTLPPIETKLVQVDLTETEREFYNAVLARSMEVFSGFVQAGTAAKSYIQIFSMLQRLRQACDHISLTVRNRVDEEDLPEGAASEQATTKRGSADVLGQKFMDDLLRKFASNQSPKKRAAESKTPDAKRSKTDYLAQVAANLRDVIQGDEDATIPDECPICLENPLVVETAVTPCGHMFCRSCLVGYLRDNDKVKREGMDAFRLPDGACPSCIKEIVARQIVTFQRQGSSIESIYLSRSATTPKIKSESPSEPHSAARQILHDSLENGGDSSKMRAILEELRLVWKADPGSKVLVFSQYLGFLDLLEGMFQRNGIAWGRLDGSLSLKERLRVLQDFSQSRGQSVLLMSMSAGGEGLNLVAASSVFLVDPWWNTAKEDQCIHRIHRIGQLAERVRVRKFCVRDTVEERILALQSRKAAVADQVYQTNGDAVGSSKLSVEEFQLIFQK